MLYHHVRNTAEHKKQGRASFAVFTLNQKGMSAGSWVAGIARTHSSNARVDKTIEVLHAERIKATRVLQYSPTRDIYAEVTSCAHWKQRSRRA